MSSVISLKKRQSQQLSAKLSSASHRDTVVDSVRPKIEKASKVKQILPAMAGASTNLLSILFRPTLVVHQIPISAQSTVNDVLTIVCQNEKFYHPHNCFLWFKAHQYLPEIKLQSFGLFPIPSSTIDLPEIRLKFVQQLMGSAHIGKHVILASPEEIDLPELLDISHPDASEDLQPEILKPVVKQIISHRPIHRLGLIFIPLPVFSRKTLDYLPTVSIRFSELLQNEEIKPFLAYLTNDLLVHERDLVVVNIRKETKTMEIKFMTNVLHRKKLVDKNSKKAFLNALKMTRNFLEHLYSKTEQKLQVEISNFDADHSSLEEKTMITWPCIDLALQLSERMAVIDQTVEEFLTQKTRQITTCLFNSFQTSSAEYVLDHINLIYHHQYVSAPLKNEQLLFYATYAMNPDHIWENFPFFSTGKPLEDGPYGRGYYFTNSATAAIEKLQRTPRATIYLLCAMVKLGETLKVTDMRYLGQTIDEKYHSHHVPMNEVNNPITTDQKPASDLYVIREADQILPVYLIGLRRVGRFVVWRDAKITNEHNVQVYEKLKENFDLNIYGCQSNVEVFEILSKKLVHPTMKCVLITNGADDGEEFVRKCRQLKNDLPVIVFCMNTKQHERWAKSIEGRKIKVTDKSDETIAFIEKVFAKSTEKK